MKTVSPHIRIVTILISIALLCSCGSSKKAVTTNNTKHQERREVAGKAETKTGKEEIAETLSLPFSQKLIEEARRWIGTPYKFGGKDKAGADCSGFVMEVFRIAAGILLPRNSAEQKEFCKEITKSQMVAGDLLFFSSNVSRKKTAHVGIYVGNGIMIHASSSQGVIESSIESNYYLNHFLGCGRVPFAGEIVTPTDTIPAPDKRPDAEDVVRKAFNLF